MYQPHTAYIICATPRSGSHLLADALQITAVAGKPDEYFITNREGQLQNIQGNIANIYGKQSLEDFHQLVLSLGSTENGVFGIIIQWDYLHHIFANFRAIPPYQSLSERALLNALFYNPKFIWLQRRDKVRQAISWVKARHTGVWGVEKDKSSQPPKSKPMAYDYFLLEQNVNRFVRAEQAWASFFKANQIEPFVVVYEELAQSFEQTSLQLLDFLAIPHPQEIDFQARKWQKQANALNEEWAVRFLREKQSLTHRAYRFLRFLRFKLLPF